MTKLTTHVLDIFSGKPGKGIKVELFFFNGEKREKINSIILNSDGRSDKPLVENETFKNGKYELIFAYIIYLINPFQFWRELPIKTSFQNKILMKL